MGDYYQNIVDIECSLEEASRLGAEIRDWLIEQEIILAEPVEEGYLPGAKYEYAVEDANADRIFRLSANWFSITVGRRVYDTIFTEMVTCPHCQALCKQEK